MRPRNKVFVLMRQHTKATKVRPKKGRASYRRRPKHPGRR